MNIKRIVSRYEMLKIIDEMIKVEEDFTCFKSEEEKDTDNWRFHVDKYNNLYFIKEKVTACPNLNPVEEEDCFIYEPDYMYDMANFCLKVIEHLHNVAENDIERSAVVSIKTDLINIVGE